MPAFKQNLPRISSDFVAHRDSVKRSCDAQVCYQTYYLTNVRLSVCLCVCNEIVSRISGAPQNQMRSDVGCFRLPSLRWRQIFAKINCISSTDHASLNANLYQLHTIQYCRQTAHRHLSARQPTQARSDLSGTVRHDTPSIEANAEQGRDGFWIHRTTATNTLLQDMAIYSAVNESEGQGPAAGRETSS